MAKFTKMMCLLIAVVFISTGCDMLNSIKEYFNKSKDKPVVAETSDQVAPESATSTESAPLSSDTLVRIGKWSLTIDQFNDRLKAIKEVVPEYDINDPKSKDLVLEELIRQQLLVADAEEQRVDKKQDIQDAIEEFRRTVLVREMATRLTENIDATEDEAKAFYEQNKANIVEPSQLRVREIKTDTEEKAKAILVEVLQGADFAQTAKDKSTATTASNGGDLGFLKELPFLEMGAPLQALTVGQVSSVFKGPDGFYIIKLEEKKEGKPLAYEEVKKDILQNRKLVKQQQAILDYIKTLEAKFKVDVNRDLLQKGN